MRRRVGLFLFCGLVLPLVVTASASAQGAVLKVSKQVVTVGEIINLEGSGGFSAASVEIRIGPTRDSPSPEGWQTNGPSFSIDRTVPELPLGWHLLQATQVNDRFRHRGFTPGRARIKVVAAAAVASVAPGGASTDAGPPTPLVVAIIGFVLLAGASALTVRRLRTLNRPLGS